MAKYKVLAPIFHGERIERGSIVELPCDVANAYGVDYVQLVGASVDEELVEVEVTPLADLSVADLRALAKERGVSSSGSKADILERLQLADVQDEVVEDEVVE